MMKFSIILCVSRKKLYGYKNGNEYSFYLKPVLNFADEIFTGYQLGG